VLGTVLLVAVTVVAAAAVGTIAFALPPGGDPAGDSSAQRAALSLAVDASVDRVAVVHRGGDALDPTALTVRIRVDGEALTHQPPVPFFASRGFESGPTGPFNSRYEGAWTAGTTAGVELASTNDPTIDPGDTVRVRLYADDDPVADLRASAE